MVVGIDRESVCFWSADLFASKFVVFLAGDHRSAWRAAARTQTTVFGKKRRPSFFIWV